MENSSNALIMAGGVLIGIILLSIIVVSFQSASDLAKTYDTSIATTSLQAFNNNFEKFQDIETNIHDIVTLAHFAKDYNGKYDLDKTNPIYIHVICKVKTEKDGIESSCHLEDESDDELLNIIELNTFKSNASGEDDASNLQKYKCKGIVYDPDTKAVTEITFEKIN